MGFFNGTIIINALADRGPTVPASYRLEQNFPNLFNPSTTTRYEMSSASHVTLKLFDLLGREVSALVDRTQQSGTYALQWNGSNYASGAYLYRMEAEAIGSGSSFTAWRKALLIK